MSQKRTDRIIKLVEEEYRRTGKTPPVTDITLAYLNETYLEVARKAFAIKSDITLLMENGTDVYDLGVKIFKIKEFVEPSRWTTPLKVYNNIEEWKTFIASCVLTDQPLAALVWNERLRLFPIPTVTGEELQVFLYLLPDQLLDYGTDPEMHSKYDECLKLGTLSRMIGGNFDLRYNVMRDELAEEGIRETTKQVIRQRHASDIGF